MWPFSIPFSINNFYIFHSKFIVWSRSFISERENVADERECFIAGCWAKNIIVEMLWNVSKEIFCFSLSRAFLKCRRKKRKGPQKNIRKENKKKFFEKKNLKSFTSSSRERVKLNWNEKFWHFVTNNEVPKYQRSFTTHRYDSGALKLSENLKSTRTLCMI